MIYSTALNENNIKSYNKCVSQIDILPTLIDLISPGENHNSNSFYGSSGFRSGDGYAFRCNDNDVQWIENDFVYNYNIGTGFEEFFTLDRDNFHTTEIITSDSMKNIYEKKCKSYLQAAYLDVIKPNN
mgnify:FL=1